MDGSAVPEKQRDANESPVSNVGRALAEQVAAVAFDSIVKALVQEQTAVIRFIQSMNVDYELSESERAKLRLVLDFVLSRRRSLEALPRDTQLDSDHIRL